ncbi:TatD family hydrolase [Arenibaculum pallidiluteum]|uniref:TatD family hydrolase n=1 Tax=Arenibaculum pallidiluteum TaxID=2812559 RepID=UPI001A96EB24|nr:TatD family hydrolase [Arenibaculum pallidiluteum]
MLVDSHCHLDFPDFAEERDEVVARAERAGVGRMVTISTHLSRFDRIRAIAEAYPSVYCSVGVHPHNAGEELAEVSVDRLVDLARHPKVVGIGESGLDYYYDKSPRDAQAASFRLHCRAAAVAGLPLIVHSRDAEEDTAAILAEEGAGKGLRGVMHCFSSARYLAEKALELGFYISFSGILTFKNSDELRTIARDVPLDRLLVETDAPYLAPVPKRGKRNEPSFVAHTAAVLAEVKGVAPAELARVTTENFLRLFDRMPRPEA